MIVGINLNAIGDRYIASMYYVSEFSRHDIENIAKLWVNNFDEVYIVDTFDNCCDDFINEIVIKGCRM